MRKARQRRPAHGVALMLALLAWSNVPADAAPAEPLVDSEYRLRTWDTEDGLPENSATTIAQTRDGYLWFGTWGGLVRFNGDQFLVFNPDNTPQLPDAGIVNLHADRRDRLWVSTSGGLVVKDGSQWRAIGTNEGWAGNYVRTFSERGNGDLLVTTFDGHVLSIENDRVKELPPPSGDPGQGYHGTVDGSGRWWLAQNRFVGYWDGQQWVQAHAPDPAVRRSRVACATARDGGVWVLLGSDLFKFLGGEKSRLPLPSFKGGVWSIFEDSRTNLWICSYDHGLYQRTEAGEWRHWTEADGLGTVSIRTVFEDREDNLWIGSNRGGLIQLTTRRFFAPGGGDTFSGKLTRSVTAASEGGVWVALYNAGLYRLDEQGSTQVFVPGPTNQSIYGVSVLEDRAGRLWYADADFCWWRRGGDRFEKVPLGPSDRDNVDALFEDSRGHVWLGSRLGVAVQEGGELRRLGPESGLSPGPGVGFGEDSSGTVWVAQPEGVFRYEGKRFTPVQSMDGQPLRGVLCFNAEANGAMWLGTRAAGLIRWQDGRLDRVGVEHGLPDCEIRGMIEDSLGHLWMPSNRGVLRASLDQLRAVADGDLGWLSIQLLDQHDGLPSAECSTTQPNCTADAAGRLWFATQRGLAAIDPTQFRLNLTPPPTQVEALSYSLPETKAQSKAATPLATVPPHEVRLNAPFSEPLVLPPGAYGLELAFAGLSLSAPEKNRIQYLLEGYTHGWLDAGKSRRAIFHQLPPGQYVFRVRAANNDGIGNETGASLAFLVQPYFWQTPWFRLGSGLLLVALGGASVWSWLYKKMARGRERERSNQALRASEARLEAGSDLAGLGYYEVDYAARTSFMDDRFRQVCGVPSQEMPGLDAVQFWLERVHPDDRQTVVDIRQQLHSGQAARISAEYRYRHPELGERWLQHSARFAGPGAGGTGIRTFGVIRDITEQKRLVEQQAEDLRFVTLIAELSSRFVNLPASELDREILEAERRICELLDLDVAAFWQWSEQGQGTFILTHYYSAPEGPTLPEQSNGLELIPWFHQQVRSGRIVAISSLNELPAEAAADREVCRQLGIKSNLSLPLSVGGEPAFGVLGLNTTRNERDWPDELVKRMQLVGQILANALARKRSDQDLQRLRLQLWHADRVAQTGVITASLAHELNQPLTGILSTAQAGLRFMAGGNPDLGEIRGILTNIVQDTKRAGGVINGLRAMLRRKETQREPFNLAEAIRDVLDLVHSELVGRQVEARHHLEPDCTVLADKGQIQQVLLNLVMNALEAMESLPAERRILRLTLMRTGTGEALVALKDSGPGIPEDRQEKLFMAFYTTKTQGMGIGLPISYSIIESHGGRLWCDNNPDQGATFSFTLPLLVAPLTARPTMPSIRSPENPGTP